jgi:hypothetical protein
VSTERRTAATVAKEIVRRLDEIDHAAG